MKEGSGQVVKDGVKIILKVMDGHDDESQIAKTCKDKAWP
jgi:hypothetical protein